MILRSDIEYKRINSLRDSYEKRYAMLFQAYINRQFKVVANSINEGNYTEPPLSVIDDRPIRNTFESLYRTVGVAFAGDSYRNIKAASDEELIDRWADSMMDYARTKAGDNIRSITSMTRKQIKDIVGKAVSQSTTEGWGMDQTARYIRNTLRDEGEKIARWRALRIARTEVMVASNAGSLLGARELGVPMNKIWTAVTDQRTRDQHYMMNGVAIDINDKFKLGAGMDAPGDANGGPENVINCRCSLTYNVRRDVGPVRGGRITMPTRGGATVAPLPNIPILPINKIEEALKPLENNIRNNNYETAIAVDRSGITVLNKRGSAKSIRLTTDEYKKIKDTYFTHNHPTADLSFSVSDIVAASYGDLAQMRAATKRYNHIMDRPATGWPSMAKIKREYRAAYNQVYLEIRREYQKQTIPGQPDIYLWRKLSVELYHKTWILFAEKLGITYRRIEI